MIRPGTRVLSLGLLIAVIAISAMVQDSTSNFVQCPGGGAVCGVAEGTTTEADLVNGSDGIDDVGALAGNDVIFGNGGDDNLAAGPGNDVVFDGAGNDAVGGGDGNDLLVVGADDGTTLGRQNISGGNDNDHILVLLGQTFGVGPGPHPANPGTNIGCGAGDDVVTFFNGPLVFEQPNPPIAVTVFDPISGGQFNITPECETIQGLASLPV
jgi:Ca2+-binding RTX toxin-like protein